MKIGNNSLNTMENNEDTDLIYLDRCTQLAHLSDARVADNPRVGAVLVHEGEIIGEGYHRQAGGAHAEVNCLANVRKRDFHRVCSATLYISLEPCCVVGRSGACTDLIRRERIPTVVFAQRDPTPGVAGNSVRLLREAGVEVREYPDFAPTLRLNAERATMVLERRPYVTLKFARSADGFLRPRDRRQDYWITGPASRRLVHRWRAATSAILVGGRTVTEDDPSLTTRLFPGPNPLPVVIDLRDRVTGRERLFTNPARPALLFSGRPRPDVRAENIALPGVNLSAALPTILREVLARRRGRVTVEGGAALLEAFLDTGSWDEAKVFTGTVRWGTGLPAPVVGHGVWTGGEWVGEDRLDHYSHPRLTKKTGTL